MEYLTNEQILERYDKLPQDVQDLSFGAEMKELVKIIGEKYKLATDKIGELENETGMVMVGFTNPNDFIPNLVQRLGVDSATAGKISEEINSQIFSKVKESMEKIHSSFQGLPLEKKDEILQEIERDHSADIVSQPAVSKVEPLKEVKYPAGDPYREPVK